jgi:mannan polymerase II complex MNN10 subunit
MEWKGAREWAIERNSIWNKKEYAKQWGYELEIVNMLAKKRYSHEWRESWEKVDIIREAMRKYPNAEWLVEALHGNLRLLTDDAGFGGWT